MGGYNDFVANDTMMPSLNTPGVSALPRIPDVPHWWPVRCALALGGSVLVAMCAHLAVPLPFTPVPFTLQPFAVLLVGMVLGPVAGFGAMLAYLMEGSFGLPVFTPAGVPGIARLLGPTGGYLLAYPFAAALAGCMPLRAEKRNRFLAFAVSGTLAMLLVYVCGAAWFSHCMHLPFRAALAGSVLPFALPDAAKVLIAAAMAAALSSTRHPTHSRDQDLSGV